MVPSDLPPIQVLFYLTTQSVMVIVANVTFSNIDLKVTHEYIMDLQTLVAF